MWGIVLRLKSKIHLDYQLNPEDKTRADMLCDISGEVFTLSEPSYETSMLVTEQL